MTILLEIMKEWVADDSRCNSDLYPNDKEELISSRELFNVFLFLCTKE